MKAEVRALTLTLTLSTLLGCGGSEEEPGAAPTGGTTGAAEPSAAATTAVARQPIDPATTGAVRGVVRFTGDAPEIRLLEDIPDQPGCHEGHDETPISEFFVVRDGLIQNVFVEVVGGLDGWTMPTAEPREVEMVQHGCVYRPHVLALREGDTLRIKNSDPTNHNVNAGGKKNQPFNKNQGPGASDIVVTLDQSEIVPLRCDIHPWMNAHVGVFDHPFVATTGADGSFLIEGLPAGTYEIEALHPDNKKIGKRGKVKASVTVVAGQTVEADLAF